MPQLWLVTELQSVLMLLRNGTTRTQNREKKGWPVTRIETISDGIINPEHVGWIDTEDEGIDDYKLQEGDILLSHINSIEHLGKCAVYTGQPPNLIHGMNLLLLRPNKSVIEPEFLLQYLRSELALRTIKSRAGRAVNQSSINQKSLQSIPLLLPPLPEQRRIVEILREADELRRLRREADERAKELLPALFLEMFGIPSAWKSTIPLKEMVDFVGGGTPSRKVERFFTGDIPWATSKDVKSRYLNDTQEHITEDAIEKSATNLVPARTILLVVKSKILMHSLPMGITTKPFCFGQDLKGLICKPEIEPEFIVAALDAQTNIILSRARGVNTEGLTLEILQKIPIPKVSPTDQKRFLEKIVVYNEMEQDWRDSIGKFDAFFPSLLAQAFSGELTAQWREQNKAELEIAATQRDNLLGKAARVIAADQIQLESHASVKVIPVIIRHRDHTVTHLSPTQIKVLEAIAEAQGYFTAWSLMESNPELSEDHGLDNVKVRNALHVLADAGLIMLVNLLADATDMEPFYFSAFRALRPDDDTMADLSFLEGSA